MQNVVKDCSSTLLTLLQNLRHEGQDRRVLVGVVGSPGSGKSELSAAVCASVNRIAGKSVCKVVGMDGWHYSRAELDKFPVCIRFPCLLYNLLTRAIVPCNDQKNPTDAHARRGAHDTFNAESYVQFIRTLKSAPTSDTIKAPSFDHSLKDPVQNDIIISPQDEIILIEGLYVALDIEPWVQAARLLDQRWVIEVPEDVAEERIWKRHVNAGICPSEEEGRFRARTNDIPSQLQKRRLLGSRAKLTRLHNIDGRFLLSKLVDPTLVIQSIQDPSFILPKT